MANRRDNLPKTFRIVPCARCKQDFQSCGPNHKRCDGCKADYKREYEREKRYAANARLAACSRCDAPFSGRVHAQQKFCEPCAVKARNEQSLAAYAADPGKGRARGRKSYRKHRQRILADRQTPEARAGLAEAMRLRRRTDPSFRLHSNVSRVVSLALNGKKAGRKWEILVGYTRADLMRHLERQFVKGMTWDNYGSAWHVDHIVPRSAFTFATPDDEQFRACWALTNLRPLWVAENLSKSGTRVHLI